jgi:hypothetical protein
MKYVLLAELWVVGQHILAGFKEEKYLLALDMKDHKSSKRCPVNQ